MRWILSMLGLGAAVASAPAGVMDFLFPKHDVRVITVTDATPLGALLRPASVDHPVYYYAVSAGYKDLGGIIAGEEIPPSQEVIKTIAKVLAKQGYLPTTAEHPATLLLIWTWGTMNAELIQDPFSDDTQGRQVNREQLLRFMGAYKLGMVSKDPNRFHDDMMLPGLLFRDADADMIYDTSTDDLYIAAIAAYDFRAAQRSEKVLLWTTKISCPSLGLALPETLPTMLAIAGPYIGRETAKPISIRASDKYKPEIKVGDPTLVEYIESDRMPVIDMTTAAAKKAPASTPKEKKP